MTNPDAVTADRRQVLALSMGALSTGALSTGAGAALGGLWPGGAARASAPQPAPLQPRYPLQSSEPDGFRAFMAYAPEADPDAPFFRAFTPRARRAAPFAPTQAHPELDPRARAASLMRCHGALDPAAGDRYSHMRFGTGPGGGVQVTRMLGYLDLVVDWAGSGMIPNPALVDAAHRYGAPCLGVIFQPDRRVFDGRAAPQQAVAAQFVRLARYFGFDGYFFNFEEHSRSDQAAAQRLIALMRKEAARAGLADFHVQYYDGSSAMDRLAPTFGGATASNSVMLDQGWSGYAMDHGCCSGRPVRVAEVDRYCTAHGLDPLTFAYFGLQLYPGPGYLAVAAPEVIAPNGAGPARGALQLYSLDDGVRDLWRVERGTDTVAARPARADLEALYALERAVFSGVSGDPALDNAPSAADRAAYDRAAYDRAGPSGGRRRLYTNYLGGAPRSSDQMALPISYGVANFVAEASPLAETPFATTFNTGEGDGFFIAGRRASDAAWFGMGLQDVLPTWQWRRTHLATPMRPPAVNAGLLEASYRFDDAFEGGSSLALAGRLDAASATCLWLYKCAFPLAAGVEVQLVDRPPAAGVRLQLGLVFQDAPDRPLWVDLDDATAVRSEAAAQGWRRSRLALDGHAGRTLAALCLGVGPTDAAAAPALAEVRIGSLFVGRPSSARPPAPTALRLEAQAPTATGGTALRLAWRREAGVRHYDICCATGPGPRRWLGRVDAERFYVADAPAAGGGPLVIEVTATALDNPLEPGAPARLVIHPPSGDAA